MKNWLITGASSEFGRLLAERVATNGDHVIAVARREDRLRELELAPVGVKVTIVVPGIFATDFAATARRVPPDETYAPTVGVFFRDFAAQPREAFGEPSSVVEGILTAVAADEPPRRIAVGTDAVQGIRASLTSSLSELDRWGFVPK